MSNDIINLHEKTTKPAEIKKSGFDFDYWSNLAKSDPKAFEVAREAEINKHISSLKDVAVQERMRRLQWRIEMERELSKNPLDAAARIYDMMWESVGRNIKALDELVQLVSPKPVKPVASVPSLHDKPRDKMRGMLSEKAKPTAVKKQTNILMFNRKEEELAVME